SGSGSSSPCRRNLPPRSCLALQLPSASQAPCLHPAQVGDESHVQGPLDPVAEPVPFEDQGGGDEGDGPQDCHQQNRLACAHDPSSLSGSRGNVQSPCHNVK